MRRLYACYLIAQNGGSSKTELIEQRLLEAERVQARQKLSTTEKELL